MGSTKVRQRGYSLIEVLVAFVILALALSVLLRTFSAGVRNVDTASDYSRAIAIADSKMALAGNTEPLQPGLMEGWIAPKFTWRLSISRVDPELLASVGPRDVQSFMVAAQVEWPGTNGPRRVGFATIRLASATSVAGTRP